VRRGLNGFACAPERGSKQKEIFHPRAVAINPRPIRQGTQEASPAISRASALLELPHTDDRTALALNLGFCGHSHFTFLHSVARSRALHPNSAD
jgi:hypothetical protein